MDNMLLVTCNYIQQYIDNSESNTIMMNGQQYSQQSTEYSMTEFCVVPSPGNNAILKNVSQTFQNGLISVETLGFSLVVDRFLLIKESVAQNLS